METHTLEIGRSFFTTGKNVFFFQSLSQKIVKQKFTSALRQCLHLPLAAISATHHAANSLRWRLRLPFWGASAFCLLVHSHTGAFISASCHVSTSHHNSASRRAPLVQLVGALSSASASPSCRASSRRLGLRHSLRLNLSLYPSCLVGCCVAQRLNPHHVATLPGASAPPVDPLLVTAFGVVCCCSHQHICPIQSHLLQSVRPPNIAISVVLAAPVCYQSGASFAVVVPVGTLAYIPRQASPS
jgi:hypothetical protein